MARILVIDDDESLCFSLQRLLNRQGHDVRIVENGEKAMRLLDQQTFDLALVDQQMPGIHGLEVVKNLHTHHSTLPAIMMTGHGSVRLAVEFMRNGGVDFIEKPFDIDIIRVKIEKALRERHLKEQLRIVEQAHQAAEQANKAKSSFLANLSHELRSPMHVILSFASLGKQKYKTLNPEKIATYFDRIEAAGNSLMELLEDVITLAKLETDRLPFDEKPVSLMHLVKRQVHHYSSKNDSIQVSVQTDCSQAYVRGDKNALQMVIDKLLDNAVAFGKSTPIQVRGYTRRKKGSETKELVVTVSDGGIGVPPAELETIFDAFSQSSYTDTGSGGSGLGLAICKEIIHMHKGTIRAENNDRGGCSVSLVLPLVKEEEE